MVVYTLSGNKNEMMRCKSALLTADGNFGVSVENLSMDRVGIFKYQLKVELVGPKDKIRRFNNRVNANYRILSGNVLGLLDYL